MKKILLLLSVISLHYGFSQNINFADANFKNFLLNSKTDYNTLNGDVTNFIFPDIDSNADGEISQSEALLVKGINFYYSQINNYGGLEFFTNLKRFESLFFNSDFNFPTLTQLEDLYLANALSGVNAINNLNLSVHPNLKRVTCAINGNINLDGLNKLKFLSLSLPANQIDLSDCINLLDLSLFAPLITIDLSNNTKLINLNLSNTEFLNLDLSACTNLEIVYANKGKMETLNLGEIKYIRYLFVQENKLTSLNTNNLFNLQQFYCNDNNLSYLSIKNDNLIFGDNSGIDFSKNPNLTTICCDANEIVYVQNICNILGYTTNISECLPPAVEARPLTMFPNPVKDILHLDTTDKINKVEVFGTNGLLIMTSETVTDVVDMQSLQSGMYFLKVYRDNSVDDMKFIKG